MTTRPIRTLSLLALLAATSANAQQSGLTAETWNNLTKGTSVMILQKEGISTRAADSTSVTGAQVTGVLGAGKGMRLRGSITPVESDTYTFWISGADNVALWLSTDASRFNKQLVAYNLTTTNLAEWDKHPNQKSIPIQLVGGQSYYLEAQVMDVDGGGHIGVAWRGQKGRYCFNLNGTVATQSSTKWGRSASLATDGNTSGAWASVTTTLTENQPNSWLQVAFPQDQSVNQVVLYNTSTNQNYLSNFRLSLLDANGGELYGENFFTTSGNVGNSMTWNLPATVNNVRKVKIQLLGNNLAGNGTLAIAEIEAYGTGLVPGQVDLREVIPSTYLTTLQADPADTDDNLLSDTWESQTGLAASSLPGAHLEFGDPDGDGMSNYQEQWLGSNPLVKEVMADGLTRASWMGITGSSLSNFTLNPKFYSYPNAVVHAPKVDELQDYISSGVRFRGTIIAPVSGEYRFWISAKGNSELWLADGSILEPGTTQPLTNRFGKRLLATSGDYATPEDDFDFRPTQKSVAIHLVQGESYYLEVLQSRQHSSGHVSLAWQYPGQARQIIPSTAYLSNLPEESDADDDNLPDAWESANAISPTDNGFISLNSGEYGDPDADGLTNLREYQLGTNPKSADSDGDGLRDGEEINLYGSDPLVSNQLAPVSINLPALGQYSSATGGWSLNSDGSLSAQERRGGITYTFTVTQPGVHEVVLSAAAIHPYWWQSHTLNVELSLDGESGPFATGSVVSKDAKAATLRAITPWLAAGTHTLTVYHNNYNAALRMRITSLDIKRLGGIDIDSNGIPDWIEQNAAADNGLTRVPAESRTSPVSIEGKTTQLASTALTVLAPGAQTPTALTATRSINDSFFADVPLSTDGAVTLDASFQNGVVTQSQGITWIATNLFDNFSTNTLHIRAGDALRLDAWSGQAADGQPFTVTSNGTLLADENQVTAHTSGQPFVATFATAGTYTLVASHGGQQATVTLQVHSANFGPAHEVVVYLARTWTPTQLDAAALIETDERIVVAETTINQQTGPRTFLVKAEEPVNRHVIARLPEDADGAPSAILARGTVHAFDVGTSPESRDAQVLTQYADGTWLMRTSFCAVNLPPDILIRLTSNNQGTLFTNGTMIMDLRAEDFDANGIANIYFEWSGTGTLPKLCHSVRIFIEP